MKITPNIGDEDRLIRILVGLALIINIFVLKPDTFWIVVLAVAGIAVLLTAYLRFCSLYLPFGISTMSCKCDDKKAVGK
jgi:uncharacterized membrane protein